MKLEVLNVRPDIGEAGTGAGGAAADGNDIPRPDAEVVRIAVGRSHCRKQTDRLTGTGGVRGQMIWCAVSLWVGRGRVSQTSFSHCG